MIVINNKNYIIFLNYKKIQRTIVIYKTLNILRMSILKSLKYKCLFKNYGKNERRFIKNKKDLKDVDIISMKICNF